MEISLEQLKAPDMSARQQANELIKLIRKLRWMGMEEEAERAETALGRHLACVQRARRFI